MFCNKLFILEAVNAIINYSSDVVSILRRKVLTRELLFTYIHQKNIPVNLPANKNDLIAKIASFWDVQYTPQDTEIIENISDNNTVTSDQIAILAEQFTQWFYSQLNRNECLPEHFFPDAKLQITFTVNNQQIKSEFVENDCQQIAQQLFFLKMQYDLYFNPNLTKDGVQGKLDPHGLVIVLVCGTLHKDGVCVGIFEQLFALARDPFTQNNWKIKSTQLNLKNENGVLVPPCLSGNNQFFLAPS